MILELNGTKVTIVDKTLGYQGDNLVDTIQVTVDKDSTWNYKLDMYKGKSKCFDSVLMTREGNICTVQLTNEILSYGGRYVFQLRGYTDTQTYHSDIFESWVNASIEYQDDCKQADCGCDCKLPTEFYQVEDNVTEINNHPPYPGDNNKWMIWDVNKHEYVESDIEVIGGGEDYQTKDNLTTSITAESTDEQYPSAKATYDYGQSIAKSAGKIDAITVNGTAQTVEDKTAKIIVNKSTVGLGNVDNTSDEDKPISTAQATAIAEAKAVGSDAQTSIDAHIVDTENPHNVTKAQVGLGNVDNTSDANKPVSTKQSVAIADAKKAGTDAQANLDAHIGNKENPHEVTKAQVGLSDVDNTSDKNKPVSTLQAAAINEAKEAGVNAQTTVEAHIANIENPHKVTKEQVGLGNADNTSDKNKPVSTLQATAIADAKKAGTDAQANLTVHINDKDNPHEVSKAQVGLGNVDNTSDTNKPISTATQTALNEKLDKIAVVDVTADAVKGQVADAKSVYDTIQAAKPDIVTPTAESTDTQAASAKAVWDMIGTGGSGTDISLGVTGASVGDIIKVKSVDDSGKPTAWEAAKTQSLLRLVGEYTLSENATLFEVINLNINADVISLRLKKGGTNCATGISIWLNGVKSSSFVGTFSDNSDAYRTHIWLWKQDNQWHWYNLQTNLGINKGNYTSGAISTPITSIGLSTPYMDGNTAEDVTEGNYIASGAVMQIYEGVFPNVN